MNSWWEAKFQNKKNREEFTKLYSWVANDDVMSIDKYNCKNIFCFMYRIFS